MKYRQPRATNLRSAVLTALVLLGILFLSEMSRQSSRAAGITPDRFSGSGKVISGRTPAAPWVNGDVFVGVSTASGNPSYEVFSNSGAAKDAVNDLAGPGQHTGCAFDPQQDRLYTTSFTHNLVVAFDANDPHSVVQTIDTDGGLDYDSPESIVFMANGDFLVGKAGTGGGPDGLVQKYDPAGQLLQSYHVPIPGPPHIRGRGADWIDLAADQHTIYYSSESDTISYYDLDSGANGDFATLGSVTWQLRLLPFNDPNRFMLVATDNDIELLNSAGNVVQTYSAPVSNWFALNLDPDGQSFWSASQSVSHTVFYRWLIDGSGQPVAGPFDAGAAISGLCLKGEITASQPTPTATTTPQPGTPTSTPTDTPTYTPAPPTTTAVASPTFTPHPTQTCPPATPVYFQLDDGSAETSLGYGSNSTEYAAIYLNRFTPPPGSFPFTLNSIQVAWPTVTPVSTPQPILGKTARLVVYSDPDGDGNPSNAVLVSQRQVTVDTVSGFQTYPVNVTIPANSGDIYIGFEDLWAEGGYSPQLYPAALDRSSPSRGRSWFAARQNFSPPDISSLGNNDVLETVDSANMPGNWLIRASGTPPNPPCQPAPTATPQQCAPSFYDVQPTDYFYEAVVYLYCHGAISGYSDGSFRPYNYTTRGQLSKIVTLSQGWPINTTGGPHFTDVPPSNPFYTFIETAYYHSIISGYADGTFRWGANVTRGQLSKIIVLAHNYPIDTSGGPHFIDVPIGSAFYTYVETAYNHSVIGGYSDGTFHPYNNATRGQISVIVYRALSNP